MIRGKNLSNFTVEYIIKYWRILCTSICRKLWMNFCLNDIMQQTLEEFLQDLLYESLKKLLDRFLRDFPAQPLHQRGGLLENIPVRISKEISERFSVVTTKRINKGICYGIFTYNSEKISPRDLLKFLKQSLVEFQEPFEMYPKEFLK